MSLQAIVIGGGIAGLASAARLRAKGYSVMILEASEEVGGKLASRTIEGYRFDCGPSLFTLPELLDELFREVGKNPADYYEYRALENITRYFFEDGLKLDASANPEIFAQELEAKTGESAEKTQIYLKKAERKYKLTEPVFLQRSLHRMSTYFNKDAAKGILHFRELDSTLSLHDLNRKAFQDERVIQLFDRYATYNGSDPYRAPGTLSLISYLEHMRGAYYPKGGMISIARALQQLCLNLGVQIRTQCPADEILISGNKVRGVRCGNDKLEADIVVCNADVETAYRKLLPNHKPPKRLLNQEKSSSALIFFWGMGAEFPELDLHNVFFSSDYAEEFKQIQEGRIFVDPTVYIYISKRENPADAPAGKENWFVMINTPCLQAGQDWDQLIRQTRLNILAKLEHRLGKSLRPLIECESILDPKEIEKRTGSARGALYGSSSNSRFSAFLRHSNAHSRYKGLYFAGGSVHPGGGIPLCLLSAKIAVDQIKK